MSNKIEKPSWKNTLNSDLSTYNNMPSVAIAASSVNYQYFTWIDGEVYEVVKEYSPKGFFIGVVSKSTGIKVSDLGE